MVNGEATVDAVDADGDLVLLVGSMRLTTAWKKMQLAELASLSNSLARTDGEEDHAVAAFFARLCGGDALAVAVAQHLIAAKAHAAAVDEAFKPQPDRFFGRSSH